jgi:transglutaminase-like putative cysteine protease
MTTHSQPAQSAAQTPAVATARYAIDCELGYELGSPADFLFLIHATEGMGQRVLTENLVIAPAVASRMFLDAQFGNRFMRLRAAPGPFKLHYNAVVERDVLPTALDAPELDIHELPDEVLQHLVPTRYCESDHLANAAQKLFGTLPRGYSRVQAVTDWIHQHIEYRIGSSDSRTTARDVFVERAGVCRDFAHLGVTFCRALNIPARLVCGYVKFEEPPPDFHAVFEAYIGGRWVMFDPTGLAPVDNLIRIATGQDAKDVAFATLYGSACMTSMNPSIHSLSDAASGNGSAQAQPASGDVGQLLQTNGVSPNSHDPAPTTHSEHAHT